MALLRLLDLRGDGRVVRASLRPPTSATGEVAAAVEAVFAEVAARGDAALRDLTERFDGVAVDDLVIAPALAAAALDALDADLRAAIAAAGDRVRWFHERCLPHDWELSARDGVRAGRRYQPIRRVGIYVPGGGAAYPSTVLMTVVPARLAGVEEIVLCTPPAGARAVGADGGSPDAVVLAAAAMLGVDRIVGVGGAQAIAAMALGTDSVPRCDKIVGPGNVYVAAAKQLAQARGLCGIDTVAGPTEVAIVADDDADPDLVAADLVAQAEHDALATCLLVTDAPDLVAAVEAALATRVASARHEQRVRDALAGQGVAVIVTDLDQAVAVIDAFAPEHLEVHTRDPAEVASRVRFAGTIFVGAMTPVSLGDYAAGPNHTLPTGGTARFAGGLSTEDFLVAVNWVEADAFGLGTLAPTVRTLAAAEDLPGHAAAIDARLGAGT